MDKHKHYLSIRRAYAGHNSKKSQDIYRRIIIKHKLKTVKSQTLISPGSRFLDGRCLLVLVKSIIIIICYIVRVLTQC